jgi:hypothetical protein
MENLTYLALVAQVLLWAVVVGVFFASGQASIFHPLTVYLAFHLVVFVIRPILVLGFGFEHEWYYMIIPASERMIYRALGVSSVGLLVFALTCIAVGWSQVGFRSMAPTPFTRDQKRALIVTTLILGPLILRSIRSFTGGEMSLENRGGTFVMTGASGYTLEAQYMAGPLICAWLCVARFRWHALLVLVPYVAYRSYAGMSRWTFVLLFVALALAYALEKRIKWCSWPVVLAAIPLLILFNFVGNNRGLLQDYVAGRETLRPTADSGMSRADRLKAKYDGPDFANFDFLTYVVSKVPERTGEYTYGAQYLQLFTEPIPRKLWPGKPAGAPVRLFNLNSYGNFLGRTLTLVGDGWMSGGWVGLIVTMAIVGSLLGWAHRWFWRHSDDRIGGLMYLIGIAMLIQWYRDGGISIAKFFFWNLSPLVLWLGITWLMGPKLVPSYSVLLPRGVRLRVWRAETRGGAGVISNRGANV